MRIGLILVDQNMSVVYSILKLGLMIIFAKFVVLRLVLELIIVVLRSIIFTRLVSLNCAVKRHIKQTVVLLFKISVSATVEGELTALTERFRAAVYSADKRLLIRVSILMFA